MDPCPECGNHSLAPRTSGDVAVLECAVCGAVFGEAHAVAALADVVEANERGVDPGILPLVRSLDNLPGLRVGPSSYGSSSLGSGDRAALPFVEVWPLDGAALTQIENLAKSLRLAAGSLHCSWSLVASFDHTLVFTLQPAVGAGLRDARLDVESLARQFERNRRLTWWRGANAGENG